MNILVWTPPWPMRGGNFYFLQSVYKQHLLVQAQTLAKAGHEVSVVRPTAFHNLPDRFFKGLTVIHLDSLESAHVLGGVQDPSADLYAYGSEGRYGGPLTEWLRNLLPRDIDVVLVFENPVPFLEDLYPDSLIVHQMPGAFSRAPYPHTIQFDPAGLFKSSALYHAMNQRRNVALPAAVQSGVNAFAQNARSALRENPFDVALEHRQFFGEGRRFLLPLQISDHYAFKVDTGFESQVALLMQALGAVSPDESLIITEYATGPYTERVCTPELLTLLRDQHPHIVFDPLASKINAVSQHILPVVDGVVSASSSLAVQSLIWDQELRILGNTHLTPFCSNHLTDAAQRQSMLALVLGQNQPLAHAVTKEEIFLSHLLEAMHAKRNLPAADRMPVLHEIDPEYWLRLADSFRPEKVIKKAAGIQTDRSDEPESFREIVRKHSPDLVSFDLFDTLILRPLENPADTYALLARILLAENLIGAMDFAKMRYDAEQEARKAVNQGEIQLEDIYAQQALSLLDAQSRNQIMESEIELEISLCRARPAGYRLLKTAQEAGCAVCITSDTYLPESCIRALIKKAGYDTDIPLYLSSSFGVTKKSGLLFKKVKSDYGLIPAKILHVGDNLTSDISPAKRLGFQTFYLPKSVVSLREHDAFANAFPRQKPIESIERSLSVGAIAHRLFDEPMSFPKSSQFGGDARNFGYTAIGPLLLGFTTWLLSEVSLRGIKDLHFLSREGRILKNAFDIVTAQNPQGVSSNYLFGSRRAIRIANLHNKADLLEVAATAVDATASIGGLVSGRFGLSKDEVPQGALAEAGYAKWSDPVGTTQIQKDRLIKLLLLIADRILENAASERETYLAYLRESGLTGDRCFGIVDVGWQANMQGALGKLLGASFTGFYVATTSEARHWSVRGHVIRGYITDFSDFAENVPLLDNRLMTEHIFCDTTPSIIGVTREDDEFAPRYQNDPGAPLRARQISPIQEGALEFVSDVCAAAGARAPELIMPPDFTCRLVNRFLRTPSKDDAKIFANHLIDDAFNGTQRRYFLKLDGMTSDIGQSYWKAGAKVFKDSDEDANEQGIRARIVLRAALPILKSHLSEHELNLYRKNPRQLFENARNPAMISIGRLAGFL